MDSASLTVTQGQSALIDALTHLAWGWLRNLKKHPYFSLRQSLDNLSGYR
jgi:hypothetical protein